MNSPATDAAPRLLAGKAEENMLTSFFVLYKTARILEQNNATFKSRLSGFYEIFKGLASEHSRISIKIISGRYFVNEQMVRFDDQGLSGAASVVAEWKMLGVAGAHIESSVTLEELSRFFTFISAMRPSEENIESLSGKLKNHGLPSIQLLSFKEVGSEVPFENKEVRQKVRAAARTTFFQAVSVVEEVVLSAAKDKGINASKTRRVVHSLIDHITRDESSLIELTAIRNFDDYTYAHSTNVCVYSLTMGVRLNLDRPRLSQLGFSALFYDIGKVKLSTDLIRKPGAYDEDDWLQMQRHPHLGAKTILRNMKLDVHTARAARGAFEHHINNDFTGYPSLRYQQRAPDLFSKVISIADTFDALTSGRVYLKKAMGPDVVLKKMSYQMKVKFDPFLLKLFSNIIGIYPAGTLVLLTTNEIALVLTNNDTDRSRPYIKIVGDEKGLLADPLWTDLSQLEHAGRKIARQIDPERYGLDLKSFVLEDK
ncbi:MAG: HD domain-containing protein [candidate division Zixibacteria bacterium]|nr:HD domain-containing protein [candidate division Zixibacteria bacterium]